MVIINFANKWEIIIIIRDKKNRDKSFDRWKKSGKNTGREKEKFSPLQKIKSLFPDFFSLIRYFRYTKVH